MQRFLKTVFNSCKSCDNIHWISRLQARVIEKAMTGDIWVGPVHMLNIFWIFLYILNQWKLPVLNNLGNHKEYAYLWNTWSTGIWCKHSYKHGCQEGKETAPENIEKIHDDVRATTLRIYTQHLSPAVPLKRTNNDFN